LVRLINFSRGGRKKKKALKKTTRKRRLTQKIKRRKTMIYLWKREKRDGLSRK